MNRGVCYPNQQARQYAASILNIKFLSWTTTLLFGCSQRNSCNAGLVITFLPSRNMSQSHLVRRSRPSGGCCCLPTQPSYLKGKGGTPRRDGKGSEGVVPSVTRFVQPAIEVALSKRRLRSSFWCPRGTPRFMCLFPVSTFSAVSPSTYAAVNAPK